MEIIVAKYAGFCHGVRKAVDIASHARDNSPEVVTILGELIHNRQVIDRLTQMGIHSADGVEEIGGGKVIISSSGAPPEVYESVKNRGLELIDATCPDVVLVQDIVKELHENDYQVIILGDKDHSEVKGVEGYADGHARIVSTPEEIDKLPFYKKIGAVVQTTQTQKFFSEMVSRLALKARELRVYNTICAATFRRQEAALELCDRVEMMVVVGGYHSANTNRLATLCREKGLPTYHIERAEELNPEWFVGAQKVGLTAGASTPDWIIDQVKERIKKLEQVNV